VNLEEALTRRVGARDRDLIDRDGLGRSLPH
jgi:hypothetical protein